MEEDTQKVMDIHTGVPTHANTHTHRLEDQKLCSPPNNRIAKPWQDSVVQASKHGHSSLYKGNAADSIKTLNTQANGLENSEKSINYSLYCKFSINRVTKKLKINLLLSILDILGTEVKDYLRGKIMFGKNKVYV